MVVVKLLGIVDLIVAINALLIHFNIIHAGPGVGLSFYMMAKAFLFKGDIASVLDFFVGVYVLAMIFLGIDTFIIYFLVLYLFQKAILSFF